MTIVDLKRYPLDDLASRRGGAMVADAQRQLATFGAFHMPGFLSPGGLATCLGEARALEPLAHFSHTYQTPYYQEVDGNLNGTDPRNTAVLFAVGYVAREDIPACSPFRALFEGDDLIRFLRAVLPDEPLYRYSEPRGSLNVTVMREGDELGWHFDACELVASILLRASESGGDFDYVPNVSAPDDENRAGVAAVIGGDTANMRSVTVEAGDLLLFRGRHSLHRVRPIGGNVSRLIGLMSFDNVEVAPPNRATDTLMKAV
jgi:hypothetical protein